MAKKRKTVASRSMKRAKSKTSARRKQTCGSCGKSGHNIRSCIE